MISQTTGPVPGSFLSGSGHDVDVVAAAGCARRFSLGRGATGATFVPAPVGGGAGGPRTVRGTCAPATGAAAPCPMASAPRDFPHPPLPGPRELRSESIPPIPPRAGDGAGRGLPAAQTTQITPPAREAVDKEER